VCGVRASVHGSDLVMLRHEYADHVAALCTASIMGSTDAPGTSADIRAALGVAVAVAEALADLRYPAEQNADKAADSAHAESLRRRDATRVRDIAMALHDSEPATAAELLALATRLGAT
jgi:hypothetical protein